MISLLDAATSGIGVYSLSEAARYAKMHPITLSNWFFGRGTRPPMRQGQIQPEEQKAISFLDFVEALAVRSLRVDHKVSFQKIREAIENANRMGIEFPFARQGHKTFLVGSDIHIVKDGDDPNPVQITGKHTWQKSFITCIEGYMKDLEFDENGLARMYTAMTYKDQSVVLNPKLQFGTPIVLEYGITAETLWRAAVAEGSYKRAAELYEVSEEAVEAAYRYFNGELGMAA